MMTGEMVAAMPPGSVILDLAAERGGNCELSQPGRTVVHGGVKILAPLNLPATVPYHASQMYSQNVTTLLAYLVKDGKLTLDRRGTRSCPKRSWPSTASSFIRG